jgi:hypothetical protein
MDRSLEDLRVIAIARLSDRTVALVPLDLRADETRIDRSVARA